jgi:prepilin-type N-terminal cleavage/methylation domain-containing protein
MLYNWLIEIFKDSAFYLLVIVMREQGFSFIELLITIAIVGVVAGMGMAVYGQYQQRAYNTNALQQGLQLRTAFEAALSDSSDLTELLFNANRTFEYSIDGTLTCVTANCGAFDLDNLLRAFSPQRGVKLLMNIGTNQSYSIQVGHCRALLLDGAQYDGWFISDNQASYRVGFATDPDEVSQCKDVIAGIPLS